MLPQALAINYKTHLHTAVTIQSKLKKLQFFHKNYLFDIGIWSHTNILEQNSIFFHFFLLSNSTMHLLYLALRDCLRCDDDLLVKLLISDH